jgi:hypothetical protein
VTHITQKRGGVGAGHHRYTDYTEQRSLARSQITLLLPFFLATKRHIAQQKAKKKKRSTAKEKGEGVKGGVSVRYGTGFCDSGRRDGLFFFFFLQG